MVAMARQDSSLSSYCGNNIFFSLVTSAKIISKKVFILFNWTFLLQMWNRRPPLFQVMKAIFYLFVPDYLGGLWLTAMMDKEQWWQTTPMKDDGPPSEWTRTMTDDNEQQLMMTNYNNNGPQQWMTNNECQPTMTLFTYSSISLYKWFFHPVLNTSFVQEVMGVKYWMVVVIGLVQLQKSAPVNVTSFI